MYLEEHDGSQAHCLTWYERLATRKQEARHDGWRQPEGVIELKSNFAYV